MTYYKLSTCIHPLGRVLSARVELEQDIDLVRGLQGEVARRSRDHIALGCGLRRPRTISESVGRRELLFVIWAVLLDSEFIEASNQNKWIHKP